MNSGTRAIPAALRARGVSRRDFVKFCSSMVATLALPPRYIGAVMKALNEANRPVLVWTCCPGNITKS
jgi:hydrogenase small subunit